ncbi:MAG TPA: hypothetical protein DER01_14575 [Phycisphaerales bacterium]|nr:hypothetical protein [Phycisphaerales bacterium]
MATMNTQHNTAILTPSDTARGKGPLHKWLASEIRNHVKTYNLEPGTPLEPEVEIAQRYQVSRGTVRQAMATLVNEGLIDRIAGRGSFIRPRIPSSADTTPNSTDHPWAGISPKTNRIRVLADCNGQPDPGHFILTQSIEGLNLAAQQMNGSCKLTFEYHSVTHVNDSVAHEFMQQDDCEGMIILPVSQDCIAFINEMGKPAKPTAVLYRHVTNPYVHRFVINNSMGAYQATDYLLRMGHRRIGLLILTWPSAWPSTLERLEGYRKAMQEAGCEDKSLVATANNAKNPTEIKTAIRQLLSQGNRPTALLVNNFSNLQYALETLEELELKIGDDVSLIGIDESDLAQNHDPQISVVHMPLVSNAMRAMEQLHQAIINQDQPGHERLTCPELRLRQSCHPMFPLENLK